MKEQYIMIGIVALIPICGIIYAISSHIKQRRKDRDELSIKNLS